MSQELAFKIHVNEAINLLGKHIKNGKACLVPEADCFTSPEDTAILKEPWMIPPHTDSYFVRIQIGYSQESWPEDGCCRGLSGRLMLMLMLSDEC